MKGLFIRNQVFPLHKYLSRHLKCPQLRTFWIQKRQKTWFLTAPCHAWLIIFLAFASALLPTLAMAEPPPSPAEINLARQDPIVRIDPAQVTVGVSETFTVSVMIDQADDLGGFEFTLNFVTATVTIDSVTVGDFPGSTGREVIPIPIAGPIIDNQAGKASLGVVTTGSASGPSGTGVLATVTLTAQGPGESPLDLQDVVVLDTNAQRQTTTTEDGLVRVGFVVYLPLILKDWQK